MVLLLDDDPAWLRTLRRVLERRGVRVVSCTEPAPVFDQLDERLPDAVVIDFVLGGEQTGADVARALRERLRHSCPPLLLVSASLPDIEDADFAAFDSAHSKATPLTSLVDAIVAAATTHQSARSERVLRPDVTDEVARSQGKANGNGSSR